jgi:CheY-like chemotaxis protein
MTGIEATRQIRALPGPAGAVPICALTGNETPEDRARCAAAGMDEVLAKPVAPDALIAVLGRLVWHHQPVTLPPEPSRASAAPPLLAAARLAELRANLPPATLADLVEQAIAELTERLAPLQAALESGDMAAIGAEAHAMAGLAAGYAMAALEVRLRAIMSAARAGNAAEVASHGADVPSLLARSTAALRNAVSSELVGQ